MYSTQKYMKPLSDCLEINNIQIGIISNPSADGFTDYIYGLILQWLELITDQEHTGIYINQSFVGYGCLFVELLGKCSICSWTVGV